MATGVTCEILLLYAEGCDGHTVDNRVDLRRIYASLLMYSRDPIVATCSTGIDL